MATSGRNFERDLVGAADPGSLGIVELDRDGGRREWRFGELRTRAGGLAGRLWGLGVRRGDIVLTLIGNRPEWVCAMLACFRMGAVVLPCNEQLRARDLAFRMHSLPVAAIVADERNRAELEVARPGCPVLWIQDDDNWVGEEVPHEELGPTDPAVMIFTSGTSGEPKCVVHGQRYLWGQTLQARAWVGLRPGDVTWCTASPGWSKSARNVFLAPWLMGATGVLHDGRFDAAERLAVVEQENIDVLCMAPTEYRAIITRGSPRHLPGLRSTVAAGEALDAELLRAWRDATGLDVRDGYGQTETGQITGVPPGGTPRPGSMGKPLPGIRAWVDEGELVVDPSSVPTFFLGYRDDDAPAGPWRTGDRVRQDDDGYLYFEGRNDDLIISAGYRIGPVEVEAALLEHDSVAEAAVVPHPDPERGMVVRAVIVLKQDREPSDDLAAELQAHVKSVTAPYKYPRIIEFVDELPRTASGKVRRSELRSIS